MDPILIMLPPCPRSIIYLPKTCEANRTAFKLVFSISSNSSSCTSSIGVGELMPAPFIRISTRPDFLRTAESKSSIEVLEVTSTFSK